MKKVKLFSAEYTIQLFRTAEKLARWEPLEAESIEALEALLKGLDGISITTIHEECPVIWQEIQMLRFARKDTTRGKQYEEESI